MKTQRLAYMVYVCDFFFKNLLAVLCVCKSERKEREYDCGAIRVILLVLDYRKFMQKKSFKVTPELNIHCIRGHYHILRFDHVHY